MSSIVPFMRAAGIKLVLALIPVLVFGTYHRLPQLAFLNYFALVPWVVLYTDDRRGPVSSVWYVLGAYCTWMAIHPVYRFGWFAAPVMGAVLGVMWWFFAPLLSRIHHRFHLPRTFSVPIVWVAVEWLRATFTLSHFDMYGLGYSQAALSPLVQIADITGVFGVSFVVASVNGLIADVLFALRDARWSPRAAFLERRLIRSAAAVAAMFAATLLYGGWRIHTLRFEDGPRAAIVQPNIRHVVRNVVGVHLSQVLMTEKQIPPGSADVILWPENAILDNIRREGVYLDDLSWLARRKGALMLVGASGKPADSPGRTTNTAFLVDDAGRILGHYDKQMLFPWSEYVPFEESLGRWFPRLQRRHRDLTRAGWGFVPTGVAGRRTRLLHLPWPGAPGGELPFAVLMCSENTYPPLPVEASRQGARFQVHLTSEGEVGGTVQQQLLWISMLRAVENRVPYVRAGNTGISCFVDPLGRLQSILRGEHGGTISVAGVHTDRLQLSSMGLTPYARSRDAFAKTLIAVTAALFVASFLPRRKVALGVGAVFAVAALAFLPGCTQAPATSGDPAEAERDLDRAMESFQAGRLEPAVESFRAACLDPDACRIAMDYVAKAYGTTQDFEGGVDFFEEVLRRHPSLAGKARGHRAFFLERSGRVREAIEEYGISLRIDPSPAFWALLGNLLLRMDDPAGAIAAYGEGLRLSPGDTGLQYLLGRAYRIAGDLEAARSTLESVVARQPDHAYAWANLGRIRIAAGDDQGATDALAQAIASDPKNIEARLVLARMALRDGRVGDAEAQLREIVRIEDSLGRGVRED